MGLHYEDWQAGRASRRRIQYVHTTYIHDLVPRSSSSSLTNLVQVTVHVRLQIFQSHYKPRPLNTYGNIYGLIQLYCEITSKSEWPGFNLSRSLNVKWNRVVVFPIHVYDFLLVFNSSIWPNSVSSLGEREYASIKNEAYRSNSVTVCDILLTDTHTEKETNPK